jgi:phage terminase large subunit-like protein
MGATYDSTRADRVVAFFGQLRHVKGRWGHGPDGQGEPFTLMAWQEHEIIRPFFGYIASDGRRIYKRCFIAVAKKNGKTALCAGLALYALFGEGEPGAEVYSAAADREQASLVFQSAAPMCRNVSALDKRSKILEVQRRIVVPSTNSFYQVLSAEVETKHGLSPFCVIFDELHAQPNRNLWDVLTAGAFAARLEPMLFTITTAGYDRNSICYEEWDYARKVRDGIIEDPALLPVIYEVPEDADWNDEKMWHLANPSLGTTIDLDDMRAEYRKAKELPANENAYRRLRLNQWVSQESRFLPMDKWDALEEPHSVSGRVHYAGLDLSSTTDITAYLRVAWDGPCLDVFGHYWVPGFNIEERERRDRAPYREWARQGFVTLTEGDIIDYASVRQHMREKSASDGRPAEVGFDPWNATQFCQVELPDDGFVTVEVRQGYRTLSAPTKRLLELVLAGQLRVKDPVLRWMADNVVVTTDPTGAIKPDKSKARQRIDGIVALVVAIDRASRYGEPRRSVYEDHGIEYI